MSPIQTFKLEIVEMLGLSKDAIHIYIGIACCLVSLTVGRKRPGSFRALLLGLAVSVALEVIDLGDDYLHRGLLIWRPSLKDIVNTNLIPLAMTLVWRWTSRRRAIGAKP